MNPSLKPARSSIRLRRPLFAFIGTFFLAIVTHQLWVEIRAKTREIGSARKRRSTLFSTRRVEKSGLANGAGWSAARRKLRTDRILPLSRVSSPPAQALIAYKLGLTNFGPYLAPLELGKIVDCFSLIRLDHCTSITVNQVQASFGAHSESDHLEIVTTEGQILELKAYQVYLFTRDLRETLTIRFKPSVVDTPTTLIGTFTPLNERILVDISDLNASGLDRDDHQFPPANLRTLLRTVASNSWQSPTPQHLTLQLTHKQISALGFANAAHFFAMVQDRLSINGVIGCDFSLSIADSRIEPATLRIWRRK